MSNTNNQETAVFNLKQKANKYLSQGKLDAVSYTHLTLPTTRHV